MSSTILRSILYHYHSKQARDSKNKKKSNFSSLFSNVRGVVFYVKEIYYIYISKSGIQPSAKSGLGLYTSPQKHVVDTVNKMINSTCFVGKGMIHLFVDYKPSKSDYIIAIGISKKKKLPFFEVLSLIIELRGFERFLSRLDKKDTIFCTNFIDRFAYIYGRCSQVYGYKIVVAPHGKLMTFPLTHKYIVHRFQTSDAEDVPIFLNYAHFKETELQDASILLNTLEAGGKGGVAYLSSASREKLNYWFLMKLFLETKKPISLYPHPRENKIIYRVLEKMNVVHLPKTKYYDFDMVFGRLSTLTNEINMLNDNVVFLNYEHRDLKDFPHDANIIPINCKLIDFKEYI